ncbi:MAG: hypothetical protein QOH47_811 [Sphingomonadales bacterium]|jgi:hypothetical protein|nr:hypothetical protein [Sphingomonadales bacterium]
MWVLTLKQHGNAYGPVYPDGASEARAGPTYSKRIRDVYEHPDPDQLIEARVLAEAAMPAHLAPAPDPLDHDGDGHRGGSLKGRRRRARAAP